MIKRDYYLNQLIGFIDKDFIKLLIGVRRSGKSTLLLLLQDYLKSNGVNDKQFININYESFEFDELRDGKHLHNWLKDKIENDSRYYLFIDEVQEIEEWSRVINSLRVTFNVDIYVTGSNSRIFIGEHLTYLAGRYVSIHVYPLSIEEYMIFKQLDHMDENLYNEYIKGSFPSYVLEENNHRKSIIMNDLYDSIFQRDIILRSKIQNETIFNKVARFVFENIGNTISTKKITDTLVSNGYKVSYNTVDHYVNAIEKAYCLYHCPRYDIKGKEVLKTNGKYYAVDLGLRDLIVTPKGLNSGFIFENVVYLELLKKGYKVYTGKIGREYEIDFVATKDDRVIYIQVSESIIDPLTREREEKPFGFIGDKYDRLLVTKDAYKFASNKYDHLNLYELIDRI